MIAALDLPFTVTPLAAELPFGARVTGLERAHLDRPATRQALFDLWIDRGVILFQGAHSSDFQVALSEVFGPLERHAFPETWVDGHPELVNIKYRPHDGTVYSVDGEPRGGWLPWHSDLVYTDRINRGGILRPVRLPARGGGRTGFIDQISAYEALPDRLKTRIEGLHVVYAMDLNAAHMRFGVRHDLKLERFAASAAKISAREFQYPRVLHPMVFRQPETGRPVLNVSPYFALGIFEQGGLEGETLLHEVVDHMLATPPYVHDWHDGDMLLWDNWRTLHSATGVEPEDTREMQRTTIAGDYALGRTLESGGNLSRVDV